MFGFRVNSSQNQKIFSDVFDAAVSSINAYGNVQNESKKLKAKIQAISLAVQTVSQSLQALEDNREAQKNIQKRLKDLNAHIEELKVEVGAAKILFAKSKALVTLASKFTQQASLSNEESQKIEKLLPGFEKTSYPVLELLNSTLLPATEKSISNEVTLLQTNFQTLSEKFQTLAELVSSKLKVSKTFNKVFKKLPRVSKRKHDVTIKSLKDYAKAINNHKAQDARQTLDSNYEMQRMLAEAYEAYTPVEEPPQEIIIEDVETPTAPQNPTLQQLEELESDLLEILERQDEEKPSVISTPKEDVIVIEDDEPIIIEDEPKSKIQKTKKAPAKKKSSTKTKVKTNSSKKKTVKKPRALHGLDPANILDHSRRRRSTTSS